MSGFKIHEKTKEDRQRRLDFLRTLPTEPNAVRAHILAEQKVHPTETQVSSWISWIHRESTALDAAIKSMGRCCQCDCHAGLE